MYFIPFPFNDHVIIFFLIRQTPSEVAMLDGLVHYNCGEKKRSVWILLLKVKLRADNKCKEFMNKSLKCISINTCLHMHYYYYVYYYYLKNSLFFFPNCTTCKSQYLPWGFPLQSKLLTSNYSIGIISLLWSPQLYDFRHAWSLPLSAYSR